MSMMNLESCVSEQEFVSAYWNFASGYVAGIRANLAAMADEVREDKAVVTLLLKLKELEDTKEDQQYREFKTRINGEEPIGLSEYKSVEASNYRAVLYDLLVKDTEYDADMKY